MIIAKLFFSNLLEVKLNGELVQPDSVADLLKRIDRV